jgi:hypothetical protein
MFVAYEMMELFDASGIIRRLAVCGPPHHESLPRLRAVSVARRVSPLGLPGWSKTAVFLWSLGFCVASCADARSGNIERKPGAKSTMPETRKATEMEDVVVYFHSAGCPGCEEVDATVIPSLTGRGTVLEVVDVDSADGLRRIQEVEKAHGRTFEVLAPIMVYKDSLLYGPEAIKKAFEDKRI